MTYCMYEKKEKKTEVTPNRSCHKMVLVTKWGPLMGLVTKKNRMERMKQIAEVERSKKAQSGSGR